MPSRNSVNTRTKEGSGNPATSKALAMVTKGTIFCAHPVVLALKTSLTAMSRHSRVGNTRRRCLWCSRCVNSFLNDLPSSKSHGCSHGASPPQFFNIPPPKYSRQVNVSRTIQGRNVFLTKGHLAYLVAREMNTFLVRSSVLLTTSTLFDFVLGHM